MDMKILFYDVEHGCCTHIITPNNKHILIDVGSRSNKSISNYIKNKYFRYNEDRIDALIITHPHEDHIFDLPKLHSLLNPRVLHRPKGAFNIIPSINTPIHQEIANYANSMNSEYNEPILNEYNPFLPSNNGGVDIEIIPAIDNMTNKEDLNTFSSIVVIKYEGSKFVITGDNPKAQLEKMIEIDYCNIKSKITNSTAFLAPHHGRASEYCDVFFRVVNPYLTIVSDKSIVHTTQVETANLYKGRGAFLNGTNRYVLTTRNDGTISFTVNSTSCIVNWNQEAY